MVMVSKFTILFNILYFQAEIKRQIEGNAFKEGGQRDWTQVLCNGGVAFQIALFYVVQVGIGLDAPLDFARFHASTYLQCAYLGALACCNGELFLYNTGCKLSSGTV